MLGLIALALLAAASGARGVEDVAASAASGAPKTLIVIEAERTRLTLYKDGKPAAVYPIAVGRASTPSPLGAFRVAQRAVNWGTGFGSRWLGLSCPWGEFGIHGTNKPGSIGQSASHGCFRMFNKDVERLYAQVPMGTPVLVERGAYGPLGSALRTLHPGDRGGDVMQVQLRLKNLGYDPGWPDGVYGEGTKRALLRFKADARLSNTHDVDGMAFKALGVMLFE